MRFALSPFERGFEIGDLDDARPADDILAVDEAVVPRE